MISPSITWLIRLSVSAAIEEYAKTYEHTHYDSVGNSLRLYNFSEQQL
jgi:hypothetical protein